MVEMPVAVASSVLRPSISDVFTTVMPSPLRKSRNCCAASADARCASLVDSAESGSIDEATRLVRAHLRRSSPNWSSTLGPRVRVEYIFSKPDFRCGASWMPTERRLRTIWRRPRRSSRTACARRDGRPRRRTARPASTWRSRRAGDEDVAAAVIAAAQHVVETGKPRRDPLVRHLVLELGRAAVGELQPVASSARSGTRRREKPEPRYFMTRRLRKAEPSTTWCRRTITQSTMNCRKP